MSIKKEKNIKVICYYLPQFHAIPENDKWWGKGFTEWDNVKKAKPLFRGHYQPRIPLGGNYYNLDNIDILKNQVRLAKEYGIYGFCFYHYWFNDKPLLEKPIINYLNNDDLDLPFCFSWANESWTNSWKSADNKVLIKQEYGKENDWKKHFMFLLPFFKDERYIKEDGCPLILIYRPYLSNNFIEMMDFWKELAKENGFKGLKIASQRFETPQKYPAIYNYLDYWIEYQPQFYKLSSKSGISKFKEFINNFFIKYLNFDLYYHSKRGSLIHFDYDTMWEYILSLKPLSEKSIAGAFVDWDNTPRYGYRGSCFDSVSPEKFEKYMSKQIIHVKEDYKNDYIFLFAWNEWGEGGYLEPDEKYKYRYLEAIKNSLENG